MIATEGAGRCERGRRLSVAPLSTPHQTVLAARPNPEGGRPRNSEIATGSGGVDDRSASAVRNEKKPLKGVVTSRIAANAQTGRSRDHAIARNREGGKTR